MEKPIPVFDWMPPKHSLMCHKGKISNLSFARSIYAKEAAYYVGKKYRFEGKKGKEHTTASFICWSIIYKGTRNDGLVGTDNKTNTRQRLITRKNVSSLTRAMRRRGNRAVVILNDSIGKIEKRCPSISNSINSDRLEATTAANRVSLAGESPKPARAIDGDIRDSSRVFGVVDKAEIV